MPPGPPRRVQIAGHGTLRKQAADDIDWTAPRLVCIAADFTKYDAHAVQQIHRNIDLIRYRHFAPDLLLMELVNSVRSDPLPVSPQLPVNKPGNTDKAVVEWLKDMPSELGPVFESLERYVLSLGDDVQRKDLKLYVAFKRLRNFATVVFQKTKFRLFLHLDFDQINRIEGFTRDVRNAGHWGTGDVEISLGSLSDLEQAKPFLHPPYEGGPHAASTLVPSRRRGPAGVIFKL